MKIEFIAIGDELLNGQVQDTNSAFIAKSIEQYGWELQKITIIHDSPEFIKSQVKESLKSSDLIITSGGLGPTKDDMTKSVLTELFGGKLIRNAEVEENIKHIFSKRGLKLNNLTLDQALVPSSCKVIMNRWGTAPVMWFEHKGKILVSLPGVPKELQACWKEEVLPLLLATLKHEQSIARRTLILSGITESDLAILLTDFEENLNSHLHLAYLPKRPYIRLRLDGRHNEKKILENLMQTAVNNLLDLTHDYLISDHESSIAEIAVAEIENRNLTLATAESCTGGNIAANITSVPGCSKIFKGGIVAYNNDIKESFLGVKKETIINKGAVSIDVVEQMAYGLVDKMHVDCAIATSGIAGPGGGSKTKPVGTVCIAIKTPDSLWSHCFHFTGDRKSIVEQSTQTALIVLIKLLKGLKV